jgi:hypothetical protein
LPYRAELPADGKAIGLANALREAAGATQQSRVIALITDLDAMSRIEPMLDALTLLRTRKQEVQLLVPEIGRAAIERSSGLLRDVWRALALAERNRITAARRRLARIGVPITAHEAYERPLPRPGAPTVGQASGSRARGSAA